MTNDAQLVKPSKPSLKDRIKKIAKPAIILAIAAVSYVAGFKTGSSQGSTDDLQDPMQPLRDSMGGITRAQIVLEGGNGSKMEISNQGYMLRGRMYNGVDGVTTEMAFDGVHGVCRTSDGKTMKVRNNEWEFAPLTKADENFLIGDNTPTSLEVEDTLESTQPIPPPIAEVQSFREGR